MGLRDDSRPRAERRLARPHGLFQELDLPFVEFVVAHPRSTSLTHSVGRAVGGAASEADPAATYEIADLAAEGFDPNFGVADIALQRREGPTPADVAAEQRRIERAAALVLVYPVYWWSMPALLEGWIDRVFTNGWAFDDGPGLPLVKHLRDLQVHLLALAGADAGTNDRHGYQDAMRTQIAHGIVDYCGATVLTDSLLHDSEFVPAQKQLAVAACVGTAWSQPLGTHSEPASSSTAGACSEAPRGPMQAETGGQTTSGSAAGARRFGADVSAEDDVRCLPVSCTDGAMRQRALACWCRTASALSQRARATRANAEQVRG